VIERRSAPPPCQVSLLQAVPKENHPNQSSKSNELGAARIVPLLSERVVTEIGDKTPRRAGKWQLVEIEAIKQCGSAWLPIVEAP